MTPKPSRSTETRHSANGKTCHHFQYHRLTCDEYDLLVARAAGRCELCGTAEAQTGGGRLLVDHFDGPQIHLIRGLICHSCNSVMSCMDGKKRWGVNRQWEARAREYEAASWHRPTPEQVALMAEIRAWQAARTNRPYGPRRS